MSFDSKQQSRVQQQARHSSIERRYNSLERYLNQKSMESIGDEEFETTVQKIKVLNG